MDCENAFKEAAYMVIADYSYPVFKSTRYSNYFTWANYINIAIKANNYALIGHYVEAIAFDANKFFGFPIEECISLVIEYFYLEKYQEYLEPIELIRNIYGSYICLK